MPERPNSEWSNRTAKPRSPQGRARSGFESPGGQSIVPMPKPPDEIIREDIGALKGYTVPDSTGMVKLDAMENPYRLPETLRASIARLVEQAAINRYPDAAATELKVR